MFVHFDHTQPLIIILVQDCLDGRGLPGSRITEKQAVVCPASLYKGLGVVDQFLLCNLISHQIIQTDMGNVCDRHDLHVAPFRMFNAERLVESQLSYSEFFIKLGHLLFEIFHIRSLSERFCQSAYSVSHPAVENLSRSASVLIIHEYLNAPCPEILFKSAEIIIKQFLENAEIMEGYFIDTALDLPDNLTGSAVGVLIIYKKKRQVSMPEIPLESMAHRKFQKCIDTFKKKTSQIFCIIIFTAVIFHKECHIL